MWTLPTCSVDANFGRRVRNRRQLNSLQNRWTYGYSMPIAVRYTQDDFSRSGWLWRVDAKGEFFFSSRRRHTSSVSAFLLNRSSDLSSEISESVNFCVMEAIKLCRLDTPIIFIEARINLSRFVVTGCAAKTSATVTFPSLNLISLFAFCFNIWLNGVAS